MKQKTFKQMIVFTVSVILWITSCRSNSNAMAPQYLKEVQVLSLRDVYPKIHAQATKWDAKANLSLVHINIGSKDSSDVVAIYEVPGISSDALMVKYEANGIVTSKIIEYGFPRPETGKDQVIEISEIEIDSIEAWFIFINHQEVFAHDPSYFEHATLILIPDSSEGNEKNLWRLALGEQYADSYKLFHIGARTGKWFGMGFP